MMTGALLKLSDADLKELATGLKSKRVSAPYSELQVKRVLSPKIATEVLTCLQQLQSQGFSERNIATTIELLLQDRAIGRRHELLVDLVTSGPETPGITSRDTAVVVRELFAHAERTVLVAGYAVFQGASVFEALAAQMEKIPGLEVKLYLDIARPDYDTTAAEIIVSRFTQRFRDTQWPAGHRLPQVFYDPRSLAEDKRSSLHAKCVVVDSEEVFISSANFSKAAQQRNIEVGLKIDSIWLAGRLIRHFQLLTEHGLVVRAF
jgi:phosphatidylserine/phosphatidylglycerophosphate/cardiolipin synthase-like enzyme